MKKMGIRIFCLALLCLSSSNSWGSNHGLPTSGQTNAESRKTFPDAGYYNALFAKTSIDSNEIRLQYAKLAYDAAVNSHNNYEKAATC